ncbi:tautomerase family protein [Paracoccus aminophilus]|uniref:Tautomerase n=1 Tax=Paracoccus aminophilus JCM 7686 TaxID=1367847 RepID=S5XUL7_PARAH|nr:tautomerase family protein [Paracoccus aminophilus]AGT11189.1 tautomerase [Paracoccus aminophilus JCM 7686]
MPIAKIHVHHGAYTVERLEKVGLAVQAALEEALNVPADDYFRLVHVMPEGSFVHTPSFLGISYSNELILLELTFISRPKELRLALLKALNAKVVDAVGISPDDLLIIIHETAGENISLGRGLAQRAHVATESGS